MHELPETPTDTAIGTPRMSVPCVATGQTLDTDTVGVALLKPRQERVDAYEHGACIEIDRIRTGQVQKQRGVARFIDHPTSSLWLHVDGIPNLASRLENGAAPTEHEYGEASCYICGEQGAPVALQVNRSDAPTLYLHAGCCAERLAERLRYTEQLLPELLGAIL